MKNISKIFFSLAIGASSFLASAKDQKVDNSIVVAPIISAVEEIDFNAEGPECTGSIIIMNRYGVVTNRIKFSDPNVTNLTECIGSYQFMVWKVTLGLQQGEYTGGTVDYR